MNSRRPLVLLAGGSAAGRALRSSARLSVAGVLLLVFILVRPVHAADILNMPAETLGKPGDRIFVVPLWPAPPGEVPPEKVRITGGEQVISNIHQPSLTVVMPPSGTPTLASVIICPGGGHRELWMSHEGLAVAEWLSEHGIASFILKYRLAREPGSTYRVEVEALADAQRAIRTVRSHAAEWHVDPTRIGILGFSAGGELAALASARGDDGDPTAAEPLDRLPSRPAFQVLVYPGNSKSIQPAKDAPPAFLVCGYDDRPDISSGLAEVYLRFKQVGVPAELHIYTGVGHGFGLRPSSKPVGAWPKRLREWLNERGFLGAAPADK